MANRKNLQRLMIVLAAVMGLLLSYLVAGASAKPANVKAVAGIQSADTRFHGACGGGTTFDDIVAGWREKGVLDNVELAAGIDPNGIDGPPLRLLRKVLVRVRIDVGDANAGNATCEDGVFKELTKPANQPEGSFVWTLKNWISPTGWISKWFADNCGNRRHGRVHTPVAPKPKPARAKPGQVKIFIRKQAFSAAAEEQLIFPTPTNVFRFKVQCGIKGKPRYIVYQSDPQPAGTCSSKVARVLIWELSTLGPDKWTFLSPSYQTFKLKGKKVILAVFKDKQVKQTPATTTTQTATTTTTVVVTTTTPTLQCSVGEKPVNNQCVKDGTTAPTTPGTGSPGSPGAGGSNPAPSGVTGTACRNPDGSVGNLDASGRCVSNGSPQGGQTSTTTTTTTTAATTTTPTPCRDQFGNPC